MLGTQHKFTGLTKLVFLANVFFSEVWEVMAVAGEHCWSFFGDTLAAVVGSVEVIFPGEGG